MRRHASVRPGETYGRLVVLDEIPADCRPHGVRVFRCRCECGQIWVGPGSTLRKGHTRSCGCLKSESSARNARAMGLQTTHGLSRHPDYVAWQSMVRRCTDPKHKDWVKYGARGITVCDRWREGFAAFHEDMGSRPAKGWHLHRVVGSRGYEPGNCEWLSSAEHGRLHAALRRRTQHV